MLLAPFCRFFVNLIKKSLTICLWYRKPMALFMSISEGVPEIKLAKVKMKMEFQSESDGAPL